MIATEWGNFFVANAGAAAALTGLIFVGVSISLNKVLETRVIPGRALEALLLLFSILILSVLQLVPHQPLVATGIEVLVIGLLIWGASLIIDIRMLQATELIYKKHYRLNIFYGQMATLPYVAGGVLLLYGYDAGLYFVVASFVLSYLKALIDAWVLLIEINR